MKKAFFITLLTLNIFTVFATNNTGYLTTIDGEVVHDGFGRCFHTGFYEGDKKRPECVGINNKESVEN